MRFLKWMAVMAAVVILAASCAGKSVTAAEIAGALMQNVKFAEMVEFDKSQVSASLLNIDVEPLEEAIIFVSTSEEKADELVVLRLADEQAFEKALSELSTHVSARAASFGKQSSAEYTKIQKAVFRRHGNILILVITEQHEKAAAVLKDLGATEIK